MAFLDWQSRFEVGVPVIDEQHRLIFELINRLHDAVSAGHGRDILARTIQGLVSYAATHFSMEEQLMREHAYPAISNHLAEHTSFVAKVADYQKRFDRGNEAAARELSAFLGDWLTDHILKVDQALAGHLNKATLDGAAGRG